MPMPTTAPVAPATSSSSGQTPPWGRPHAVVAPPVFGTPRRDLTAAGVLSGVAGYVDAAGFLGLYGLFAAHITGDLVAAGTTFGVGLGEGLSLRLVAIAVFMISVAVAALVARAARRRRRRPLTALFALMTFALALFCTIGVLLRPQLQGRDEWAVVVTGAVAVFGMGIQNALMKDVLYSLGATTLMTGNLTQLTMDLVELVLPDGASGAPRSSRAVHERGTRRIEARRRLIKSTTAIAAFLLGSVLGGIAITMCGFWSIALPATATGALTLAAWSQSRAREDRTPGDSPAS